MPRMPALLAFAAVLLACRGEQPTFPVPPLTTATAVVPLESASPPAHTPAPLAAPGPAAAPTPAPVPAPAPPHAACDWQSALLPSCEALPPPLTASAKGNYWPAAGAVDREACKGWNSGGYAPQAITLDLGQPRDVGQVVLVAAMTPGGAVTHVVEVSDDGARFEPRARYEGDMAEGGVYRVALSPPAVARYVRVRTERSPSWVAWHQIVPVACAGEHATPPAPAPPKPSAPVAPVAKPR